MRDGRNAGKRWQTLLVAAALVAAAARGRADAEPTVAERAALCDLSRFLRPKTWQELGVQPCRNDIDTCRVPDVYCSNGHVDRLWVAQPFLRHTHTKRNGTLVVSLESGGGWGHKQNAAGTGDEGRGARVDWQLDTLEVLVCNRTDSTRTEVVCCCSCRCVHAGTCHRTCSAAHCRIHWET